MCEKDAVPLLLQLERQRVQADDGGAERALEQQPWAGAKRQRRELLGGEVDGARHRDLRSPDDAHARAGLGERGVGLIDEPRDRRGVVVVAPADVRRGDDRLDAALLRAAR